jgi:hypothetical protein
MLPVRAALPHPGQKLSLVRAHLPDERLIASILVRGRPQHHVGEHGCEVNPFRGEPGVVALYYQTA